MNSKRGLVDRLGGLTFPVRLAVLIACYWTSVAQAAEKPILVLDAGGHTDSVPMVLFTPDGKQVISASKDKTIRIWNTATGEMLRVLRPPIGEGRSGNLYAAALSPDGQTLAVGGFGAVESDCPIYLIQLATGQIQRILRGHGGVVVDVAFSHDGKLLASGGLDTTARLWNVDSGASVRILEGHINAIYDVAFAPNSTRLVTASADGTARIWIVPAGTPGPVLSDAYEGKLVGVRSVAWSPDGKSIATGSGDQLLRLWNYDGTLRQRFGPFGDTVTSVAFTPDSRELLFTRGYDRRSESAVLNLATGKERVSFTRHTAGSWEGALSRDGTLAVTSGTLGEELYLWQTGDGKLLHRLGGRSRATWSAAWSPDGKSIGWGHTGRRSYNNEMHPLERSFDLTSLEFGARPDDQFRRALTQRESLRLEGPVSPAVVQVIKNGQVLSNLQLQGDRVTCFTLLSDARAAVGGIHGLHLFDVQTGRELRLFKGHTGDVWAVSPSPDGRYLVSASYDHTLRIWSLDRDEPLLSCFFAGDDWVVWTPEGYYAASPGGEKLMGWHANNGREQMASFYPASQFRSTLYRPDVIKLLLYTGSLTRALETADAARGRMTERTEVAQVLPPKVRITSPVANHKALQNTVAIRATATSVGKHPVTVLRLLLDGRPYQGQRGVQTIASPKLGDVNGEWTIELEPGKHKLKVLADSAVSQGISEEVEVVYVGGGEQADQVRLPKLYVVAVGISDYPGDLKLSYAAKDAEALTVALKSHSKSLFREIEAQTITNAQATRAAVLKGLGWLRSNMTQNDYGVFFFAGHREFDNDGSVYFLPVDVDPQDLLTTAIGDDQFKKALAGIPGKMMTMLDSCNSGAVAGSQTGKRRAAGSSLTDDLVRDLVTDENGVVAMCSSTGREFSLENNEHRQGNFTLALVEGLSGKADFNKDGVVYLNELDTYVTDRVKELTKGQQHPVTGKPGSIRSFPLAKP